MPSLLEFAEAEKRRRYGCLVCEVVTREQDAEMRQARLAGVSYAIITAWLKGEIGRAFHEQTIHRHLSHPQRGDQ